MSRQMFQAVTTMNALQQKLDMIGNNLSNSNTTGYKQRGAEFSTLLFQHIDNAKISEDEDANRLTPRGIRIGTGAKLGGIKFDLKPGSITKTDRELDVALLGKNTLFTVEVMQDDGLHRRYTRDGTFYLSANDDGSTSLVTRDGNAILGKNGPITFEDGFSDIQIQDDGIITVSYNGGETQVVGQLAIADVERPGMLETEGNNLFRLPENVDELGFNAGDIIHDVTEYDGILESRAIEHSTVDISKQMTELIKTQRSYELNAKSVTMNDQMMGLINRLR